MGEGCAFGYTNKTRIIAHVFLLFKKNPSIDQCTTQRTTNCTVSFKNTLYTVFAIDVMHKESNARLLAENKTVSQNKSS